MACDDVPNNEPVRLFNVATPFTVNEPVTCNEPVIRVDPEMVALAFTLNP